MPTVTALRPFTHQNQTVQAGDPIEMDPTDALIHARKGNITLSRQVQTRDLAAETPQTEPETPRRKRYRRRDLQAEP